ncbi:hypothetical protein BDM02DRAFT_3115752, partial [Thelephora ganbajun]
ELAHVKLFQRAANYIWTPSVLCDKHGASTRIARSGVNRSKESDGRFPASGVGTKRHRTIRCLWWVLTCIYQPVSIFCIASRAVLCSRWLFLISDGVVRFGRCLYPVAAGK